MGMVMSPVSAIDSLYFEKMPAGRALAVKKAVRVDRLILVLGENDKLYCNSLENYAYTVGKWPWTDSLMRALKKLGVITQEQLQQHLDACERAEQRRTREFDREQLAKMAKRHGFKITAAQDKALGDPA